MTKESSSTGKSRWSTIIRARKKSILGDIFSSQRSSSREPVPAHAPPPKRKWSIVQVVLTEGQLELQRMSEFETWKEDRPRKPGMELSPNELIELRQLCDGKAFHQRRPVAKSSMDYFNHALALFAHGEVELARQAMKDGFKTDDQYGSAHSRMSSLLARSYLLELTSPSSLVSRPEVRGGTPTTTDEVLAFAERSYATDHADAYQNRIALGEAYSYANQFERAVAVLQPITSSQSAASMHKPGLSKSSMRGGICPKTSIDQLCIDFHSARGQYQVDGTLLDQALDVHAYPELGAMAKSMAADLAWLDHSS